MRLTSATVFGLPWKLECLRCRTQSNLFLFRSKGCSPNWPIFARPTPLSGLRCLAQRPGGIPGPLAIWICSLLFGPMNTRGGIFLVWKKSWEISLAARLTYSLGVRLNKTKIRSGVTRYWKQPAKFMELRHAAYLLDIFQSAKAIKNYTVGYGREEFLQDSKTQDAVLRRFLVAGEAAARLTEETRSQFPEDSFR